MTDIPAQLRERNENLWRIGDHRAMSAIPNRPRYRLQRIQLMTVGKFQRGGDIGAIGFK
jgi:hypothetical protein